MYKIAYEIAVKAHEGQVDKGGKPYINHPLAVAEMLAGEDEKIVALLHDVCEDSEMTIEELRKVGFSDSILLAVETLTKKNFENYNDYIERVKNNKLALIVKIADMKHNSDISRIGNVQKKDVERTKKYQKTIIILEEKLKIDGRDTTS